MRLAYVIFATSRELALPDTRWLPGDILSASLTLAKWKTPRRSVPVQPVETSGQINMAQVPKEIVLRVEFPDLLPGCLFCEFCFVSGDFRNIMYRSY